MCFFTIKRPFDPSSTDSNLWHVQACSPVRTLQGHLQSYVMLCLPTPVPFPTQQCYSSHLMYVACLKGFCSRCPSSSTNHQFLPFLPCSWLLRHLWHSKTGFLNHRAAARYRALVSIIPGREMFSCNLSF